MIEHLGNCHGEWMAVLSLLASIPFIGVWFRSYLARRKAKQDCPCGHEGGEQH